MSPIRSLLSVASGIHLFLLAEDVRAEVHVRRGPNFLVLEGASGVDGCLPRDIAKQAMRDRVLAANRNAEVDPKIAVVFSLEVPPCADLFYAPVENDVRGIGYQHLYPEETFDESPDAALEGVAFLNDVPYWEFYPDELRRAFLHEVGHRWGVRVHVAGEDPMALLGRDHEHFSYFLDTASDRGVSPLEGNVWEGAPPEFLTRTDGAAPGYSDLDLYLMGLKRPEDVAPFRLLVPEEGQALPFDCAGARLHAGSPPQRCDEVLLRASERVFSAEDVIEIEGPRIPAASEEPVSLDVGFYFFSASGVWTLEGCQHWEREVAELEEVFRRATDGRMTLANVMPEERASQVDTCATLLAQLEGASGASTAPWRPPESGCSTSAMRRSSPPLHLTWFAAALWVFSVRTLRRGYRHGHKKVPG